MAWFRPDREKLIARIDEAFEREDAARSLKVALKGARAFPDDPDLRIRLGDALLDNGGVREAAAAYRETVALSPEWAEAWVALADVQVEMNELVAAEETARRALELDPAAPAAHHVLAAIFELTGRPKPAARAYAQAARLDPDGYFEPVRVTARAFDVALRHAIDELPPDLRAALADIRIEVRRFPGPGQGPDGETNPLILGLFEGTALPQRSSDDPYGALSASITLFQGSLERQCATEEDLIDEIHVTLLHEIGHYLGMDEEAVWKRGLR
jgi:predicted Zn-dependent protease with MMP-like domain